MQVSEGDDFGWPYCYYSVEEKKLVLAPEYGGDGKKVDRCAQKKEPVATFPGHWAPNALFFYTGSALPAKYKNGAFIAFHGSWNRAPEPQAGFNVVFQPLSGEKAGGRVRGVRGRIRAEPRHRSRERRERRASSDRLGAGTGRRAVRDRRRRRTHLQDRIHGQIA